MTDTNRNFNTVTGPQQAIEEFAGERFIQWVMEYVAQEMDHWKSLNILASGQFRGERVKKFLIQRYLAAEEFWGGRENDPGLIGFALANLSETSDPMAESASEILTQKRDIDASRQALRKLLAVCGINNEDIARAESKEITREYIAGLSDIYSTAEWQMVVGAFAAAERIRSVESEKIIQLVKNNLSVPDRELEPFAASMSIDSEAGLSAGHVLDKAAFDAQSRQLVFAGIERQMSGTREFLDKMVKYLLSSSI